MNRIQFCICEATHKIAPHKIFNKRWTGLFPLLALVSLASCSVGPDYKKPEAVDVIPTDYRWKKAEPRDEQPKGDWWQVFHDEDLNKLVQQAIDHNQELKQAVARVEESRSKARVSESDFFPQANSQPTAIRARSPALGGVLNPGTTDLFAMPLDLSYEVDLWGRVRRSFESAQAQAQASAADYHNVLLVLTADVASNYFILRTYDAQIDVLQQTLEWRQKQVELESRQFESGLIAEFDVSRAKAEAAASLSDIADMKRRRAETEAALALLCGQTASTFEFKQKPLNQIPPEVPVGLPSELLERRPDVASAERTMAARNAEIGVAYAAFFPSIRLTGQGGYVSTDTSSLFSWENHFWMFGPSVSIPLFNGGRNESELKEARAAYEESVAGYRQQVLVAFKDVEVALAQIKFYKEQGDATAQRLEATQHAAFLADERYHRGSISYLDIIEVHRDLLNSELEVTRILGQRTVATVKLIEALGGSWLGAPPQDAH